MLGLTSAEANQKSLIERAFRKKALELHPDKWAHLGDEEKEAKNAAFKDAANARDELLARLQPEPRRQDESQTQAGTTFSKKRRT